MRDNAAVSSVTAYYNTRVFPEYHTTLTDGIQIPCANLSNVEMKFINTFKASCPYPFVVYKRDDGEKSPDDSSCAIPCPSFLFSETERLSMYTSYVLVGLTGL